MYDIEIYADRNGYSDIAELFCKLNDQAKTSKDSRIRLKKIVEYIEQLKEHGTQIGYPVVRHIVNTGIWELRPTSDRIFFVYWKDNKFILLHHYVKKMQKTPKREIEKALKNLADFLERSG